MKIAIYNWSLNSFATGKKIHSTIGFTEYNDVKRFKISIAKGKVKFLLGMIYFATLMFSLFILLT
ncbi:MAG: hypothetical protein OQK57_05590 [Ignavibacteriaceae bacterium]|nr:hypothetical protein [Ignavibacteriaceae bacterium]